MILFLICALLAGLLVGGWLGWNAAARDTGAEDRVKVLEGELQRERELRANGNAMYLDRLARCRGCVTCNTEPQGLGLPDYEFGASE